MESGSPRIRGKKIFQKNCEKKKGFFVLRRIRYIEAKKGGLAMTIREEIEQREQRELSPYACLSTQTKGREYPAEA